MDERYDPTRLTLEQIEQQLDESAADLAAGRIVPAETVLAELRAELARAQQRRTAGVQAQTVKRRV